MLKIQIEMSNKAARAAEAELREFFESVTKRMTQPDRGREANPALGYVVLGAFRAKLRTAIAEQDVRIRAQEETLAQVQERHRQKTAPSVRERRGV